MKELTLSPSKEMPIRKSVLLQILIFGILALQSVPKLLLFIEEVVECKVQKAAASSLAAKDYSCRPTANPLRCITSSSTEWSVLRVKTSEMRIKS